MRKVKSTFHGKNPPRSGKLKELFQNWSRGERVRGKSSPKLKLEHPKIQPCVVEGKKLREKRGTTGEKGGFWLILLIAKRLRQQQFRNSWWSTNSSSFKSLMEVEPRKTGVKSREKSASTLSQPTPRWKAPRPRAAQVELFWAGFPSSCLSEQQLGCVCGTGGDTEPRSHQSLSSLGLINHIPGVN